MDKDELNKCNQRSPALPGEEALLTELSCDTYAGIVHVEWDTQAPVTPIGQLVFFIQFLKTCDLFGSWIKDCPLTYRGPRGPAIVDVLGTLFLAVLSGYKRYAHILIGIENCTFALAKEASSHPTRPGSSFQ